jgi:serine/threonine-protein kinase RsbW
MADQALDDLLRVLAEYSLTEDLIRGLSLAVSEAFTNAILHGNRKCPDKNILVILRVRENEIVADIIDHGKGGIEQISTKKPSAQMDEGGRGIDLIRHYADSSHFTETEDGGLKVSVVFGRTRQKTT